MNKILMGLLAFIFALTMTHLALAQEKAKKEEAAVVAKPTGEKSTEILKSGPIDEKAKGEQNKEVFLKPFVWRLGGEVKSVDLRTKTLSIHQETVHHDRVVKMKVNEKVEKELASIKAGDLVNIWVNSGRITELHKVS
jgi:hypothetical protein